MGGFFERQSVGIADCQTEIVASLNIATLSFNYLLILVIND